jgi:hypothetical protein
MAEQPSTPAIDPKELERLKSIFGSSHVQKSNLLIVQDCRITLTLPSG